VLAPLYHQVYAALRDNLLAGVWPAGSLLPSERELCELYGVSRITARKALQQLADERLVSRRQGLGSVANGSPGVSTQPPPMPGTMQALLENVAAIGASTTGRLIEIGLARPSEAVRLAMAVSEGARLHRSRHLRLRQDEPIGLITTWLPRSIGERRFAKADLEKTVRRAVPAMRWVERICRPRFEFLIGEVRCRASELCEPCRYVEKRTAPGVLKALVERGGIRAEILDSGTISVGDPVVGLD
jgi:DNA-binding GntR family transcriptional regulator